MGVDKTVCLRRSALTEEEAKYLPEYFSLLQTITSAVWRRDVGGPLVPIPYGEYKNKPAPKDAQHSGGRLRRKRSVRYRPTGGAPPPAKAPRLSSSSSPASVKPTKEQCLEKVKTICRGLFKRRSGGIMTWLLITVPETRLQAVFPGLKIGCKDSRVSYCVEHLPDWNLEREDAIEFQGKTEKKDVVGA